MYQIGCWNSSLGQLIPPKTCWPPEEFGSRPHPLACLATYHLASDEYAIDVARIHQRHDGPRHIVQRGHVESRSQHDDVGFLPWRQRSDLRIEMRTSGPLDGRE